MKILLVNDDSLYAEGLAALVKALAPHHDLYIAAPKFQQSAKSHALTMNDIVPTYKEWFYEGPAIKEQWAIGGTPADCVKIAFDKFKGVTFDVVLSGINHGPNLGVDTIYSGTVAAAIEASFHGVPAMAVSLFEPSDTGFEAAAAFMAQNLDYLLSNHKWDGDILNINFGDLPFKGVRMTTLGCITYDNPVKQRYSPRGDEYYWIAGDLRIPEDQVGTDVHCISEGYISISPLKFQFDELDNRGLDVSKLQWTF